MDTVPREATCAKKSVWRWDAELNNKTSDSKSIHGQYDAGGWVGFSKEFYRIGERRKLSVNVEKIIEAVNQSLSLKN